MFKKRLALVCCAAALLAGCSTMLPTKTPDAAQDIQLAQQTYMSLAGVANAYLLSPGVPPANATAVMKANEVAHELVSTAVQALQMCPASSSGALYDPVCANSSTVVAAASAAVSAVQQFDTALTSAGAK